MNPLFAAVIASVILSGAQAPQPYPSDIASSPAFEIPLEPGEFHWLASASTPGELIVVVSLNDQRAYVHRGDKLIAVSTISSGRPGLETPTGVFPILEKKKVHYSNRYDDAPMPFMQRLTWHGVAMHAGQISGQPSSHGCIRLPKEFAKQLYGLTQHGGLVIVSDDTSIVSLLSIGVPDYLAVMIGARTPSTTMLTDYSNAPAPHYGYANDRSAPREEFARDGVELSLEASDGDTFANPE
jgi:hypothetical protein